MAAEQRCRRRRGILSCAAWWPAALPPTPSRPAPACSLSGYRREFAVREHAAQAALPGWVAAQPSLQAIRQHPRVPASLLPRLEALWEARQAQQP